MLNMLSVLAGTGGLLLALLSLLPLLGGVGWLALGLAGPGLVLGLLSRRAEGRVLNLLVLAAALVHLSAGADA